jgi:hypothetical protein
MNRLDAVQACPPLANLPTTAAAAAAYIGVGEHHEGIGAAELEHDLLHMPACDFADGGPGLLRAGHRNALDARVRNGGRDLGRGDERVEVTPSGKPASARTRSTASADCGQFRACLRTIVLPRAMFGAAKRATW